MHDFLIWKLCQFFPHVSCNSFGSFGSVHRERAVMCQQKTLPCFLEIFGLQTWGSWSISAPRAMFYSWPLTSFCRAKKWKVKKRLNHKLLFTVWIRTLKPGDSPVEQSPVIKSAPAHWFGDRGFVSHVGAIEGDPGLWRACALHMYSTGG